MSSSAQLSLWPWLLRWPPAPDRTACAAGLHAGSSLGLALALRPTVVELRKAVLASIPAGFAGLLAHDAVERRLGRPGPTAALLAGAGALLWAADRRPSTSGIGPREAVAASLAQVLALAPGVSRSGATLTVLRLLAVRRDEAFRHSLVLSLPVTAGAAVVTAVRARQAPAAVPSALAAVAAYATWRGVSPGSPKNLPLSGAYRLVLAAVVVARLRREHR